MNELKVGTKVRFRGMRGGIHVAQQGQITEIIRKPSFVAKDGSGRVVPEATYYMCKALPTPDPITGATLEGPVHIYQWAAEELQVIP